MFIELVDSLRCVEPHEDTWLVAAVTRMDGRHIAEGKLGCPVCHREYPIRDGVAWFATREADAASLTRADASANEDHLTRAGAFLGLTDGGGIVAVSGIWANGADGLAELGAGHVVLLNTVAADARAQEVSSLVVDTRLPFRPGSVRAVALDRDVATPEMLASAAHVLQSRGRLVAPSDATVPNDVVELARDSNVWVGERVVAASPPVQLRSARR